MAPFEPSTWAWWTWVLHALAAYYVVNFFVYFFRFGHLEVEARDGDAEAVERFNRSLRGFPASGYAKMLGYRPLEEGGGLDGGAE